MFQNISKPLLFFSECPLRPADCVLFIRSPYFTDCIHLPPVLMLISIPIFIPISPLPLLFPFPFRFRFGFSQFGILSFQYTIAYPVLNVGAVVASAPLTDSRIHGFTDLHRSDFPIYFFVPHFHFLSFFCGCGRGSQR